MIKFDVVELAVNNILEKLGNEIIMAAPLGAGKPNHLINSIYKKAKNNPEISLTICTALSLQRPIGKSDLERRFIKSFDQRIFGDYPDLNYELERKNLPDNIKILEFYYPPGKFLRNLDAQRNYLSSNYTHVCRDLIDRGVNLIVQMVSQENKQISLSCNADLTMDLLKGLRKSKQEVLFVGQVNSNLPFMYGDALLFQDDFDILIDQENHHYKIFGPPKSSIPDDDYMIGLYASSLVKDDGELQVGIGSLGDAVIYGLILRQNENSLFNKILESFPQYKNSQAIIKNLGETGDFKEGLFGATEMMVDGFMELYKNKILKKKVYDHIVLQRLINEDILNPEEITGTLIDHLIRKGTIKSKLNHKDCEFLVYWGIFKDNIKFEDNEIIIGTTRINSNWMDNREEIIMHCLGNKLKNGNLMHAGFFLGPTNFYEWLRNLPVSERKLFAMKSVLKVNQLYGHEVIDRLHRKNARFINTCMMTTLSGGHVSDGLESGQIISGVGGQFNFVAMAQELPDGHSVITMRSTRMSKGVRVSNFVFNYGHITIPRHMRDILVTEYGIAYLRGKTDEEIIIEILKVCDSEFQEDLLKKAKMYGKIDPGFELPNSFKLNTPDSYKKILNKYKESGMFTKFPFGTDLTDKEITLGGALKRLKLLPHFNLIKKLSLFFKLPFVKVQEDHMTYLALVNLDKPLNFKEKIYQRLISLYL